MPYPQCINLNVRRKRKTPPERLYLHLCILAYFQLAKFYMHSTAEIRHTVTFTKVSAPALI